MNSFLQVSTTSTTTTLSPKTYLSVPSTQNPVTIPSFDAKKISQQKFDSTAESPIKIENISFEENDYPTTHYSHAPIPNEERYQWQENYTSSERLGLNVLIKIFMRI